MTQQMEREVAMRRVEHKGREYGGEIEESLGVEALDVILEEHRKLVAEQSSLWAKYGPGGVADHLRKQELARISENLRAVAAGDGRKVSEKFLDDAAHCHRDYSEFLSLMMQERRRYFQLDAQIKSLEWRINRGQSLLRHVAAERRMS